MKLLVLGIMLILGALSCVVVGGPAFAQGFPPELLPERTAELWLASIDAGNYAESYEQAAQYFKTAVAKDQWQKSLQATRAPLGKVVSRKLKSATQANTLPGAPDGRYVVILYETRFEQKQSAVETVTTMLDTDGTWKVAGYFIK